jgi:hypothetical protein
VRRWIITNWVRLVLALIASSWAVASQSATNSPLRELRVIRSYGDSAAIFDTSVSISNLARGIGYFLLTTIETCRSNAVAQGKSPQSVGSMGDNWLEWATLIALKQNKLLPAYWQAEFEAVPHSFNDVVLWTREHGPVIISCKTSLRERYKQADLEALAVRQFFPNAKLFLLTLDADRRHVARTRHKIAQNELLALQAIYAEDNADELFAFLKTLTLTEPPAGTLKSGKIIR